MTALRATARLQLHAGFDFAAAADQVGYFSSLGVSHLYLSPIAAAMPGSSHGYDGIDPTRINPELGGEAGFLHLAGRARAHGLGLILDWVPNHLAAAPQNAWWSDVLMHGRRSPYAYWFDIDWDAAAGGQRLWLPVLDRPLDAAIGSGMLRVDDDGDLPVLRHHDLCVPLSPRSYPLERHARQGWVARCNRSAERMHALLERQHYHLAWWRTAGDQVNYRRFFDITTLVALRVEREDVFETVHALPLWLVREGRVDGLRIDHVDGLSDPGGYLARLRACLDAAAVEGGRAGNEITLHVEKILAEGESLPERWCCDGTTGYDFMDQVGAWLHDDAGSDALTAQWQARAGDRRTVDEVQRAARDALLDGSLHADLQRLRVCVRQVLGAAARQADVTDATLRRAVCALLRCYPVYRPYHLQTEAERDALQRASEAAAEGLDEAARTALRLLVDALQAPDADALRVRFGQLSAPLNAKAVEDTAFYRYFRLLSRNEVGSDAQRIGLDGSELLALAQARARQHPLAMLALATHDHKRGPDARARLALLSSDVAAWQAALADWERRCDAAGMAMPLPAAEAYALWQALVAAWPMQGRPEADFAGRMQQWLRKALREGKRISSWLDPDLPLEDAACAWLQSLLAGSRLQDVRAALAAFVERIAPAGASNGLAQLCLQLCLPGVPDIYQGTEFWDLSLVDPDNRRAVDFAQRAHALADDRSWAALLHDWHSGLPKLRLLAALLRLRSNNAPLFLQGTLRRLSEPGCSRLVFVREYRGQQLLVAVRRAGMEQPAGPGLAWQDAAQQGVAGVPQRRMRNVLDGRTQMFNGSATDALLFAGSPVAVWISQESGADGQQ
ncbi:malto-oligosyltrehalose synthase [Stenotrophomonas sp. YAU14A_MKIMI4_1]|uniref:malto-oligosyltrehalose synthase n=1 Tax=Stenotrophomonas sp. YAU14A_MKIMI4_1 TaxID=2072408 RepID=UPI000D541D9E|nr:malto-oligosyltrehalose synthase [Stenotrophomonas sp. YAU14A_MKIMI4_1]AWH29374.1 malto-oligosyltrehalose synthase [Stenotrophomonas sp. YAU14A_MKIMI4_1]